MSTEARDENEANQSTHVPQCKRTKEIGGGDSEVSFSIMAVLDDHRHGEQSRGGGRNHRLLMRSHPLRNSGHSDRGAAGHMKVHSL